MVLRQVSLTDLVVASNDNERPCRNSVVEEFPESEDICRVDWPEGTPVLNLIKYVWDALGRYLAERCYHEKWQFLPQELLDNLI
ncbi:hypothetical protein TNCV_4845751 [Trichonephila clavipes]|uniref:Uncharacterized protein n=1 Tax=Trichonephila clavipes TaxID=2585209 RepID=A0A8X6WJG3_TRICX|nr:hypothetical protein TNCV_4845751 [Trichonephila clavipes]